MGETKPVPFVEAFLTDQVKGDERGKLAALLLKVTRDPILRLELETREGFVAIPSEQTATSAAEQKKN